MMSDKAVHRASTDPEECPTGEIPVRRSALRLVGVAVKCAISVGLIWYLFSHYAPGLERFASVNLGWALAALVALFGTLLPSSERWRTILAHLGARASWPRVFRIFYAGVFFTQVLPSIGGDIIRVAYYRTLGTRITVLIISVVLDRGLALCAICLLTVASLPYFARLEGGGPIALSAGLLAGGALALAYIGAAFLPSIMRSNVWLRVPESLRALTKSIAWALTSKPGLLRLLPLSISVHLLSISAMFFISRGLHVDLSFWDVLAVGPIILFAHMVPISIGGWGVREAVAIVLLTLTGMDSGSALALSVVFGVLAAAMALPGLLFWLLLSE